MRQHTKMRTLNVAICRLRRKVGDAGDQLPLHTVHGIGYVFLGKLREFAEPLTGQRRARLAARPSLQGVRLIGPCFVANSSPYSVARRQIWRPLLRNHAKSPRKPLDRLITELHYCYSGARPGADLALAMAARRRLTILLYLTRHTTRGFDAVFA